MSSRLFCRVAGVFMAFGLLVSAVTGVFAAVTGTATLTIPELRAVTIVDDTIIHDDPAWNYLGLFSYTSDTTPIDINNIPLTKTASTTSGNFSWTGGNIANHTATPTIGGGMANIYQDAFNGAGTRTLTVTDLTPGQYYTLQFFTSDTPWESIREGIFTFSSTPSGNDVFAYYSSNSATAPAAVNSSITINQKNLSATFTDAVNPMSMEYTFKAESDTFSMSIESITTNNTWHVYGLGLAQRTDTQNISLATQTLTGSLDVVNGKIVAAAYIADSAGMATGENVTWTLEMASSLDGTDRITLASGSTQLGDENGLVNLQGNNFVALNLDPSFEAAGAGEATAWQVVKSGAGVNPFPSAMEGARGYDGSTYMGLPSQAPDTDADGRNNAGAPGILRSGEFDLTGDAITFRQWGGMGTATGIPLNENNITDFLGVAIRDVETGNYVAFKTRSVTETNWNELITFTEADIEALMNAGVTTVTLDLIDDYGGSWGWAVMDDFQMLGDLVADNGMYYFLSVAGYDDLVVYGPGLTGTAAVPEPATWLMLLLGLAGMVCIRRKR